MSSCVREWRGGRGGGEGGGGEGGERVLMIHQWFAGLDSVPHRAEQQPSCQESE